MNAISGVLEALVDFLDPTADVTFVEDHIVENKEVVWDPRKLMSEADRESIVL